MTMSERWRKSSRSGQNDECVELHPGGAVRDSKNPVPTVAVDLRVLVSALKADRFTQRAD